MFVKAKIFARVDRLYIKKIAVRAQYVSPLPVVMAAE